MKPFLFILVVTLCLSSCSTDDTPNYEYRILPIEAAVSPQRFTLNTVDTLKLMYKLPTSCYAFNGVYYQYQDSTRIVAVNSILSDNATCTDQDDIFSYNLLINVRQRETYVFKLWKGNDADGTPMYDEIIVPVDEE